MSSNSSCETTKTGMSNPNRLFIMDLISFESLSLSSMSAQKTTLPLLRYVETAVYPSSAKPAFNSDIAILFLPLILIPLNKATYLFIQPFLSDIFCFLNILYKFYHITDFLCSDFFLILFCSLRESSFQFLTQFEI